VDERQNAELNETQCHG